MRQSGSRSNVTARTPDSPAGVKRKLQRPGNGQDAGPRQQTISDLLNPSQQKAPVSGKRVKLDHSGTTTGDITSTKAEPVPQGPRATALAVEGGLGPRSTIPPEKMYSFPSRAKHGSETGGGNNTIDLTSSPNNSPARKNGVRSTAGANFAPRGGAKQLMVKNLRTSSKSSDAIAYSEQVWKKLDQALSSIFAGQESLSFSLEELYKGVENVCRRGHAGELADRLKTKCQSYVGGPVREVLVSRARAGMDRVDLIKSVLLAWKTWMKQVVMVRWLFFYLDRAYLLKSSSPTIDEMAVSLFRSSVFEDPNLHSDLVDGSCDMVLSERKGDDLDRTVFKDTISMFHGLSVYTDSFEPRFLASSQSFIVEWAADSAAEKSLVEYVNSAQELLRLETDRCDIFGLDSSTRRDVVALYDEYIIRKQDSFLTSRAAVTDRLDSNDVQTLTALFSLLQRCSLGHKLREPFTHWIHHTGTAIVFDEATQDQMVVRLLILKRQLDEVWRRSFRRDGDLGHALRQSFEAFINQSRKTSSTWGTDNSKPAEMIAKYVDGLLRGGTKAIPATLSLASAQNRAGDDEEEAEAFDEDSEVNAQLDQVLDLFRFVHGKAVFEAFYKKDLARRLLMGRSASQDAERSMLQRLRTECGAGFTQNLEQMFKDIELSREELKAYKTISADRGQVHNIDLTVNVLSAASWPTYSDIPVIIPVDVKAIIDQFESYYKSKHSNRRLEWKHALAHCQVRAHFPRGIKELVVSSFQAIVLLQFNDVGEGDRLDYEHIRAATGLPEQDLKRTLQSLACAKLRPLAKHPRGRDIAETDTFSWDPSFRNEKFRLKINQIQLKETKEENKATHERVAQDRNFEAQAAIVRILKGRKRISHSELIAEVITATRSRGVLQVQTIKANIEKLIEKDYLEREGNNEYSYVA